MSDTYHPITKILYAMRTRGLRPYMSLSLAYCKQSLVSFLSRGFHSMAYQSLGGCSSKRKAGDQPCRILQVVELGGNDRICGEKDRAVDLSDEYS